MAALVHDARSRFRELHVASLDFAKVFDSVSHEAMAAALERAGLPQGFVQYVAHA